MFFANGQMPKNLLKNRRKARTREESIGGKGGPSILVSERSHQYILSTKVHGTPLVTFRPSGATKHWKKHGVSRLFCLFAHLHLLSYDSFSSLIFFVLTFSSLTLPTSAFPSVHSVGSLTSKLPSNSEGII